MLAQALARVEILRRVPPQVFWPRPKVESAIIAIEPKDPVSLPPFRFEVLRRLVNGIFQQRRKTVLNVLTRNPFCRLEKEDAQHLLQTIGVSPEKRSETLSVATIVRLALIIGKREDSRL